MQKSSFPVSSFLNYATVIVNVRIIVIDYNVLTQQYKNAPIKHFFIFLGTLWESKYFTYLIFNSSQDLWSDLFYFKRF
jgi:hypothetical protein